tara:strand:- start:351 stop:590 length:240 start_codon:yes stop_codon:yes gene_type:complete
LRNLLPVSSLKKFRLNPLKSLSEGRGRPGKRKDCGMERSSKKDTLNRAPERKENELFDPAGVSGLYSFRYRGGFFNENL